MIMKKTSLLLCFFLLGLVLTGCLKDKAEKKIRRLNGGKGTWQIESVKYEYYNNSTGTSVDSSRTVNHPGEYVFFTTKTANALYDYYLCVENIFDASGTGVTSRSCEVFDDGTRVDLRGAYYAIVWTVVDSGRSKQVWAAFTYDVGTGHLIKTTMTLKKGERN